MAELPEISSGLFPDGLLGIRGWRRNQGLIEQYAEAILGDEASQATLDQLGQLGAVQNLVEQARRANTREEQRPYISALANVTDALTGYDYQAKLAMREGMLNDDAFTAVGSLV